MHQGDACIAKCLSTFESGEGHAGPGFTIRSVEPGGTQIASRVFDAACGEWSGERVAFARDESFDAVRESVDPDVRGERARHGEAEFVIDDRRVRHEREMA